MTLKFVVQLRLVVLVYPIIYGPGFSTISGGSLGFQGPINSSNLVFGCRACQVWRFTLPETNIFAPENRPGPNRKVVFQPSIFRGENVSFREGRHIFFQGVYFFFEMGVGVSNVRKFSTSPCVPVFPFLKFPPFGHPFAVFFESTVQRVRPAAATQR